MIFLRHGVMLQQGLDKEFLFLMTSDEDDVASLAAICQLPRYL